MKTSLIGTTPSAISSGQNRLLNRQSAQRLIELNEQNTMGIARRGLIIRATVNVHPEVRTAAKKFARWLRSRYEFPVRVPVYLSPRYQLKTSRGEMVSAFFFLPEAKGVEPFIKIATGDYLALKRTRGRNNALASVLCSLAHEVIHYRQWIDYGDTTERGVAVKSTFLVREYATTVKTPL